MSTISMPTGTTTLPRPPLARGWPILGSALALNSNMHGFLRTQYQRLGPVFRVRALKQEFVVLGGPEAAELLAANDGSLSSYELWAGFAQDFGVRRIILMLEGEEHALWRKVMRQGFSKAKGYDQVPLLANITRAAFSKYAVGERIPVLKFLRRLVADQLGMLTLGQVAGDLLDDMIRFIHTEVQVNFIRTKPRSALCEFEFLQSKERVREYASTILEARRSGKLQAGESNFADDMLAAQETYPGIFEDDEILLNILMPFLAGLDTVVNALLVMLYEIHRHPEVLQRLRGEIQTSLNQSLPTAAAFRSMNVLHAAAMESMRLHPVASLIPRVAVRDFEFHGHQILKGEGLMLALSVPLMMEQYFPNPERFDLDRFLEPRNEHKQHKGVYMPFGAGSHVCLGAGIAEVQMAVTVATLLQAGEMVLDPPNYRLKPFVEREMAPDSNFYLKKTADYGLRAGWLIRGEGDTETAEELDKAATH
ncbi:MAG: cytochrome P450 [Anaerolineae bacterium]